jgi:molybdopterin-guanine dinucleotide biosynthesis protein A
MLDGAVVLAGGQSRRMGQDKALLPWRGTTLLGHSVAIARSVAGRVYVVSVRDYGMATPDGAVQWVTESQPQGPWYGFGLGFGVAIAQNAGWVLVLACDLPLLEPGVLQSWAALLPSLPPETLALVPRWGGLWQGLCALYHRGCWPHWQEHRAQGGQSFQPWLDRGAERGWVYPLEDVPAAMMTNCNTPEEWRSLT